MSLLRDNVKQLQFKQHFLPNASKITKLLVLKNNLIHKTILKTPN